MNEGPTFVANVWRLIQLVIPNIQIRGQLEVGGTRGLGRVTDLGLL